MRVRGSMESAPEWYWANSAHILTYVFRHVGRFTLARCAKVNRLWRKVAIFFAPEGLGCLSVSRLETRPKWAQRDWKFDGFRRTIPDEYLLGMRSDYLVKDFLRRTRYRFSWPQIQFMDIQDLAVIGFLLSQEWCRPEPGRKGVRLFRRMKSSDWEPKWKSAQGETIVWFRLDPRPEAKDTRVIEIYAPRAGKGHMMERRRYTWREAVMELVLYLFE